MTFVYQWINSIYSRTEHKTIGELSITPPDTLTNTNICTLVFTYFSIEWRIEEQRGGMERAASEMWFTKKDHSCRSLRVLICRGTGWERQSQIFYWFHENSFRAAGSPTFSYLFSLFTNANMNLPAAFSRPREMPPEIHFQWKKRQPRSVNEHRSDSINARYTHVVAFNAVETVGQ